MTRTIRFNPHTPARAIVDVRKKSILRPRRLLLREIVERERARAAAVSPDAARDLPTRLRELAVVADDKSSDADD